ncbi:hypothetical protein EJB05_05596, partial [Eragrostis curvula]
MRARDAAARQPQPPTPCGLPLPPPCPARGGVDVAATATRAGCGSGSGSSGFRGHEVGLSPVSSLLRPYCFLYEGSVPLCPEFKFKDARTNLAFPKLRKKDLHHPIINMGWLSKIFKGSVNRVSRGHYNGNSHEGYSTQQTKSYGTHDSDDEDMDHAIALSLSEEDQRKKGKAIDIDHRLDEDEQLARALQENTGHQLDEDEQLARALQESMNDGPPPRRNIPIDDGTHRDVPSKDIQSESAPTSILPSYIFPSSGLSFVAFTCMVVPSPSVGFVLDAKLQSVKVDFSAVWILFGTLSASGVMRVINQYQSTSLLCMTIMRTTDPATESFSILNVMSARTLFRQIKMASLNTGPILSGCRSIVHPMKMMVRLDAAVVNEWRLVPKDSQYITLDDGRRLCLECLHTAVMDTEECQPLYIDIQEFYEGLNMKVEQQIPLLLVERQALNEAMEAEKIVSDMDTTFLKPGVCACQKSRLSELLLTGSILAHEMMHAYLRLKGYRTLSPEVEEGICQVLAHLWLESEITSGSGSSIATSSASSSSSSAPPSSKKGAKTDFEKKLGEFFKHQIETDSSVAYGDGFRAGIRAVERYGLRSTLDHIKLTGSFP